MTKPLNKDMRAARLDTVTQRPAGNAPSVIETGRLTIHLDIRRAEVDGEPVPLTGKEFQVLELLALSKGTTLTKEMLLNHLYGGLSEPELKIIDVFVCKLRRKIREATGGDHYIDTMWGRGYVLRETPANPDADRVGKSGQ